MWLAPVTISNTGCVTMMIAASGSSGPRNVRYVPAGDALVLEPGAPLVLRMRDSTVVKGRFLGRELMARDRYAPRYDAWARGSTDLPLVLGESLSVELGEGRTLGAEFAGFGTRSLLVRLVGEPVARRVPYESIRAIRKADGGHVPPDSLLAEDAFGHLPSAEVLLMDTGPAAGTVAARRTAALRVPIEEVATAGIAGYQGAHPALILLGVAVDAVLIAGVVGMMAASSSPGSGCDTSARRTYGAVTDRPFDRVRCVFVDEALAWAADSTHVAARTAGRAGMSLHPVVAGLPHALAPARP